MKNTTQNKKVKSKSKIKGYILSSCFNDELDSYFCRADNEIPIFETIKAAKDYCDEVWQGGSEYRFDKDVNKWMFVIDDEYYWAIKVEITLPKFEEAQNDK